MVLFYPWCSNPGFDLLRNVLAILFFMIRMEIICRRVKRNQWFQVHEWVVYEVDVLLDSVGNKVKIHKITPTTGIERGDIEIRDYVVL